MIIVTNLVVVKLLSLYLFVITVITMMFLPIIIFRCLDHVVGRFLALLKMVIKIEKFPDKSYDLIS